jgi:hypothetical protein
MKVNFTKSKETKGTWQFKEDVTGSDPPFIGTLYVPKRTLDKLGNPDSITVTLEKKK